MDTNDINNMNLDSFNNINVPVPSKTSLMDRAKEFVSSRRRTVVASSSFLIAMVMTGSVFYLAYRTYSTKTNPDKIGAANPSCYIELQLNSPSPVPTIAPTPVACVNNTDIALVIDRSSSMYEEKEFDGRTKLAWEIEAANKFIDQITASGKKNIRVSVTSFGRQGNDGKGTLPVINNSTLHIALSNDYAAVKAAINQIVPKEWGTCIQCGIRIGNGTLLANVTSNAKFVILMSDGQAGEIWDGTEGSDPDQAAIDEAKIGRVSGIKYYTIGYGVGSQISPDVLTAIAGGASNYKYRPDVTTWTNAFLDVLNTICGGVTATTLPTKSPTPTPKVTKTPISKATATPKVTVKPTPTTKPVKKP